MANVLVIGSRTGSLGWAVEQRARTAGHVVVTAGISGEDILLDVLSPSTIQSVDWRSFHHVVCTVGVNDGPRTALMAVNAFGPLVMLDQWLAAGCSGHFVAVSSNCAHIARAGSDAYCMSKAALSMGLRCVAREVSKDSVEFMGEHRMPAVYGYEPGWIEGTPMSHEVAHRLDALGAAHHRIPSGVAVDREGLAALVVNNLSLPNAMVSGVMFRVDGGEQ